MKFETSLMIFTFAMMAIAVVVTFMEYKLKSKKD